MHDKIKILCFGDSNTYGFNPLDGSRYDINQRWSGILKTSLKNSKFEIIENGCNNRTLFNKNEPLEADGAKILENVLKNCRPEVVILALGINDVQKFYTPSEDEFYIGLNNAIKIIKDNNIRRIILLEPPCLDTCVLNSGFAFQFDEKSVEMSLKMHGLYNKAAKSNNLELIELSKIAHVSKIDGLHYDVNEHIKIAQYLKDYLTKA